MNDHETSTWEETETSYTSALIQEIKNPDSHLTQQGVASFTEDEENNLNCISWNIDSNCIAGVGLFQSGTINNPANEAIVAGRIKHALEKGSVVVHPISIDAFLETEPRINVAGKILSLSNNPAIGVKDSSNRPRAIIITGFTHSKFLTKRGLQWLLKISQEHSGTNTKTNANQNILPTHSLSKALDSYNTTEREELAACVFASAFSCNWQSLAQRKNETKKTENIITIIVIPEEALRAFLCHETGTPFPVGNQSDFLFRVREFLSNV